MRKIVLGIIFLMATTSIALAQDIIGKPVAAPSPTTAKPTPPPAAPPAAPRTHLKVGDKAPDFTLPSTIVADGKTVRYKLSDFKDKKNVVLAFYIFAFTGG